MTIKETTFNIPEMTYYVEIDDGFAEFRGNKQLLPGIKKRKWLIQTLPAGL